MRPPTVLLALLLVPAATPAQEPDGSREVFWDVPVVTPAGQASRVSESPSTTYVVTGDELRRSGAYSLTEILRRVPGMDVRQLTATDGQLGLRGFAYEIADRVLVMVDGRTVYLDFLGSTAYEMLPVSLADVERIEVVFGPGAAVYGNKAMLGTVNIITRSADDYPFVEGRVDAGLAGEARVGARAGMVRGPWRARVTGLARSLVLYGPGEERATAGGGTLSVGYRPSAGVEATVEAGVMTGGTYIIPTGARIDEFQATLAYARAQARLWAARARRSGTSPWTSCGMARGSRRTPSRIRSAARSRRA